eukprot:7877391-Alexandrium_andersonii.AAC.1
MPATSTTGLAPSSKRIQDLPRGSAKGARSRMRSATFPLKRCLAMTQSRPRRPRAPNGIRIARAHSEQA